MRSPCIEGVEEEDLFAAALALPSSERDCYLNRACGANAHLLDHLKCLLKDFTEAESFLLSGDSESRLAQSRIASYRLLRELGEGGCGIAYLAEQLEPVKREVALKIIKPGMDTRSVIARFEAERQVLALLDHPNIAKVFDAGATPEGRPYFVMEVVRGIWITEYCAQCRLTIPERLALFVQVCHAIQHAHQKGIIHRDIKPSNVLVTMHDGSPVAKVIDFGIAKATEGRLLDHTACTATYQLMGTPAYLSPEQTEPTQSTVDIRSDIYSLGVLLYELLTGYTPLDANELLHTSIDRLRQRICTEEPLRPSKRLGSMEQALLAQVSAARGTTGVGLIRQVKGDLDWIAMKCLEKETCRRYQAVNDLAGDIDRHLRFKPIGARPPTLTYNARKFARRNRVAFSIAVTAVVFVLFITTFAIISMVQAKRVALERDYAELEKQRAEKTSNVALRVFALADPFQSPGTRVSGSALLDEAARSVERELGDQPKSRARLLQAIGRAYKRRGEFRASIDPLTAALQIFREMPGAEREALRTMVDLSAASREIGDLQRAQHLLLDAERLASRSGLHRTIEYADLLLDRARTYERLGRIAEARADVEMSLQLVRDVAGNHSFQVAEALGELAVIHLWNEDFRQAEPIAREALRIYELTVPPMYPDRISAQIVLAQSLYPQHHLDEAASLIVDALQKQTELFGRSSSAAIDTLDELAVIRYAQGRFIEAEKLSREAVERSKVTNGEADAATAYVATTLARTLLARGEYHEAEAILREALNTFTERLSPDHEYIASTEYFIGEVLLATGRPEEAENMLAASMHRWERTEAQRWRVMRSANALGEAIYRQGRLAEGQKYMSESLRALSADPKAESAAISKARERATRYPQDQGTSSAESKQRAI